MRTTFCRVVKVFVAMAAPNVCGHAAAQTPRADAVDLTKRVLRTVTEWFVVLPPQLVVSPKVTAVHFSPDKNSALVERIRSSYENAITPEQFAGLDSPPGEISLYWWDTKQAESRPVWKDESPAARVIRVWWMPKSTYALVVVQKRVGITLAGKPGLREELWRVSARGAKAELVEGSDMYSTPRRPRYNLFNLTSVSPTLPLAEVFRMTFEDEVTMDKGATKVFSNMLGGAFEVIGSGGRRLVDVDYPKDAVAPDMDWDVDGKPVVGFGRRGEAGEPTHWYSVDPSSGKLNPLRKKPELYDERAVPVPEVSKPLQLVQTGVEIRAGSQDQGTQALWIQTADPTQERVLL